MPDPAKKFRRHRRHRGLAVDWLTKSMIKGNKRYASDEKQLVSGKKKKQKTTTDDDYDTCGASVSQHTNTLKMNKDKEATETKDDSSGDSGPEEVINTSVASACYDDSDDDEEPKKPVVEAKVKNVITWKGYRPGSPFPPLPGGSKLLYMENLSPSIQESDVLEFFKDAGQVDWVRLDSDDVNDNYEGYGHIRFHTSEAAQKALKRNGENLIGYALDLVESEERTIFDMLTPTKEQKFLFMGNLSPSVKEQDIIEFFKDAGKVVSVRLVSAGGHFKGYAHVEFASSTVAHKAIRRYGQILHGRYVELVFATEKTLVYSYTPSSGKPPRFGVRRGPGSGPTKDRFRCKCTHPVPGAPDKKNQPRCRSCLRLMT